MLEKRPCAKPGWQPPSAVRAQEIPDGFGLRTSLTGVTARAAFRRRGGRSSAEALCALTGPSAGRKAGTSPRVKSNCLGGNRRFALFPGARLAMRVLNKCSGGMNMFEKKISPVFSLVVSLCSLVVAHDVAHASEQEHNRCQREFGRFSDWSAPVNLGPSINTEFNEFHAAISADELSIFFATNRPGGLGGLDLWVAQRSNRRAAWQPA